MAVRKTNLRGSVDDRSSNGIVPTIIITQNPNTLSEGLDARQKSGNGKPSVVKTKAWDEGGEDMAGRYPFLTCANKFLTTVGSTYAESTLNEMDRRYRQMDRDLRMLAEKGEMKTSNPERMDMNDVLAYVGFQKSKGLKEESIRHNLSILNDLFKFIGNPAVDVYKARYPHTVPKRRSVRYPSMDENDLVKILSASQKIPDNDWKRLKAYAIVLLALSTGLRLKELRLSNVNDIDTVQWIFHAERVKGEDTYGQARDIPIRPEARNLLVRYLKLRNRLVAESYSMNPALFPALKDKGDGYYAPNTIQTMKTLVEKELNIKFNLRMCRRTYGQLALDEGITCESVSLYMGHNTTKTTETYYCRKKPELAIREAQQIWNKKSDANPLPITKTPRIESKFEVTGYV